MTDLLTQTAVEKLHHWSLANGLVMYPPNFVDHSASTAPVTLFPTTFPRTQFLKARKVQTKFNELYAKVAMDEAWVSQVMSLLVESDPEFTGKLWSLHLKAKSIGIKQPLSLGLVRSDYMLDAENTIRQVEYNAISVSFGGLSSKVSRLHNYLSHDGVYNEKYDIQISNACDNLAEGICKADFEYRKITGAQNTVVLFLVQSKERNVFDQRHLEYTLLDKFGLKSSRLTLADVPTLTKINEKGALLIGNLEVSVVYYRSGYGPSDYKSQADWDSRLKLETSLAIKCPTILSQLTGAKKIQQLLTSTELLSKYLSAVDVELVKDTFVNIYPLDSSDSGKAAKQLAFSSPEKFVLKPQREGGGNNIYKEDIPGFLKSLPEHEWEAYVLMDLIETPRHKSTVVRNDEVYSDVEIVSELGVFGVVIWDSRDGNIIVNDEADYLLRSKFSSSNEGGVAAGFGCVDSVHLHD